MSEGDHLDLEETEALVDALARRCDGLVVLKHSHLSGDSDEFEIIWRGPLVLAMGLLARGSVRLDKEALSSSEPGS